LEEIFSALTSTRSVNSSQKKILIFFCQISQARSQIIQTRQFAYVKVQIKKKEKSQELKQISLSVV